MIKKFVCFYAAFYSSICTSALADDIKNVPSSSISDQAKDVRDTLALVGLAKEYIIDKDTMYDSYFLGAETITFKPGARLIFSQKSTKTRRNLIVTAKLIVMEDQAKPGIITWDKGTGPSAAAPQAGQAPGGSNGVGDGQSGGAGSNGAQGGQGIAGDDAPNLTLFVMAIQGAPPVVDLGGQPGGIGGGGQQGGNGGVGHQGSPASQSAFGCKSGAGYGGNGGAGGNGGTGGTGGSGGAGGTAIIVSLPSAFPALLQLIRTNTAGGPGGDGGPGGSVGAGGPGGSQGAKSLPFCNDEPSRAGHSGSIGQIGTKGSQGNIGIQGDVSYTTLDAGQFERIYGIK